MKRKITLGLLAVAIVGWFSLYPGATGAETAARRPETQWFMRQKLGWSQNVMEGLALERYDLIAKSALRLKNMTQSNLWFRIRQPDYLTLSTNFQASADALYLAAVDKNLNASTEAFTRVTRNCVECHRLVRVEQHKAVK